MKTNKFIKRSSTFLPILFLLCLTAYSQQNKNINNTTKACYQNPILGGDYPDPSIIRDGKDYYMTHSSFEYYPGLLVWHSTDLVHWERVSYALTEMLALFGLLI